MVVSEKPNWTPTAAAAAGDDHTTEEMDTVENDKYSTVISDITTPEVLLMQEQLRQQHPMSSFSPINQQEQALLSQLHLLRQQQQQQQQQQPLRSILRHPSQSHGNKKMTNRPTEHLNKDDRRITSLATRDHNLSLWNSLSLDLKSWGFDFLLSKQTSKPCTEQIQAMDCGIDPLKLGSSGERQNSGLLNYYGSTTFSSGMTSTDASTLENNARHDHDGTANNNHSENISHTTGTLAHRYREKPLEPIRSNVVSTMSASTGDYTGMTTSDDGLEEESDNTGIDYRNDVVLQKRRENQEKREDPPTTSTKYKHIEELREETQHPRLPVKQTQLQSLKLQSYHNQHHDNSQPVLANQQQDHIQKSAMSKYPKYTSMTPPEQSNYRSNGEYNEFNISKSRGRSRSREFIDHSFSTHERKGRSRSTSRSRNGSQSTSRHSKRTTKRSNHGRKGQVHKNKKRQKQIHLDRKQSLESRSRSRSVTKRSERSNGRNRSRSNDRGNSNPHHHRSRSRSHSRSRHNKCHQHNYQSIKVEEPRKRSQSRSGHSRHHQIQSKFVNDPSRNKYSAMTNKKKIVSSKMTNDIPTTGVKRPRSKKTPHQHINKRIQKQGIHFNNNIRDESLSEDEDVLNSFDIDNENDEYDDDDDIDMKDTRETKRRDVNIPRVVNTNIVMTNTAGTTSQRSTRSLGNLFPTRWSFFRNNGDRKESKQRSLHRRIGLLSRKTSNSSGSMEINKQPLNTRQPQQEQVLSPTSAIATSMVSPAATCPTTNMTRYGVNQQQQHDKIQQTPTMFASPSSNMAITSSTSNNNQNGSGFFFFPTSPKKKKPIDTVPSLEDLDGADNAIPTTKPLVLNEQYYSTGFTNTGSDTIKKEEGMELIPVMNGYGTDGTGLLIVNADMCIQQQSDEQILEEERQRNRQQQQQQQQKEEEDEQVMINNNNIENNIVDNAIDEVDSDLPGSIEEIIQQISKFKLQAERLGLSEKKLLDVIMDTPSKSSFIMSKQKKEMQTGAGGVNGNNKDGNVLQQHQQQDQYPTKQEYIQHYDANNPPDRVNTTITMSRLNTKDSTVSSITFRPL